MITKTEAIVLRSVDFQESSLIVTLFTRKHGKVAVIAKGARRPKSKLAAFFVPGQILEAVIFMKETREVQTLSDVSYLLKLDNLRTDLEKMALSVTALELTSQIIHSHEPNEDLFQLLVKMLSWINDREHVSRIMFPYLQIRLADAAGVGLQPDTTISNDSGTESGSGYMNIESGTISEIAEGSESIRLTPLQFAFVRESLHSMNSGIFTLKLSQSELSELIEYLDRYFRYHFEGTRPRKSDAIFEQILKN
ncbi:DNA repair protein RecO [Rhodohalobacter mucosus]|uniref:DNA repair protein RecO n=1 Tax=Rhodohalobacter mucosus TaxID=2079485 RepID=A0A316TU86_9BACT|nr:DNA repair protein RecO [Rhodohalobacter mucosus]PWN06889.1 DNA repair protein RecO [Rhodohalobacter mucosus]